MFAFTLGASAQAPPNQPIPIGPPPADSTSRQLRENRNAFFNRNTNSLPLDNSQGPGFLGIQLMLPVRPELPTAISDAILVGTISSIQPYLSQNHCCVYTEFTVSVEKIIDQLSSAPIRNTLAIDEIGGSAILANGRTVRTVLNGAGKQIAAGERYLFFLKYVANIDAYTMVKAWELTTGKTKAMAPDDLGRVANNASKYDGMDVQAFLSLANLLKAGGAQP